jgi:YD repeat-containing protein
MPATELGGGPPGPDAPNTRYRFRSGRRRTLVNAAAPHGQTPDYGNPLLSDVTAMLSAWRDKVQPNVPSALDGPAEVNPSNGNLVLSVALPAGGPFDPTVVLVYNSLDPQSSEFGVGWSVVPKQSLVSLTAETVNVTEGTGTSLRYRKKDDSDRYLGPGGDWDALQFNEDDGTWMQTQPDGFQIHYDTDGNADMLLSGSDCWTLIYDGGNRLSTITGPLGGLTTFSYDVTLTGDNSIHQPDGRITHFLRDPISGNLLQITQADGSQITFTYDDSSHLVGHVDPAGVPTSYSYDYAGRLQTIQTADGLNTTFTYETYGYTEVTDPRGGVTTLLFNLDRNIAAVIDPLGNQRNYFWDWHHLQAYADGDENLYSLTYEQLSDRTYKLNTLEDPLGNVYTFAYDGTQLSMSPFRKSLPHFGLKKVG